MHTVSSQFLSRAAAEAAVLRLVHAGFERRDISVSGLDEPHLPKVPSIAPTVGATVGGVLGAVLGGVGVPLIFAWLGQGHATHSTDVAIATGATLAFVLGSRLGALVALYVASRDEDRDGDRDGDRDRDGEADEDDGHVQETEGAATTTNDPRGGNTPWARGVSRAARPRVVVVRTVEALSRHAGRILERSGANHISTEC